MTHGPRFVCVLSMSHVFSVYTHDYLLCEVTVCLFVREYEVKTFTLRPLSCLLVYSSSRVKPLVTPEGHPSWYTPFSSGFGLYLPYLASYLRSSGS